jgi:hypothetical protein
MGLKLRVVTAVLLAAASIQAHHGSAAFDQTKPVRFVGLAAWSVNTLPPNAATRQGVSKASFAAGRKFSPKVIR